MKDCRVREILEMSGIAESSGCFGLMPTKRVEVLSKTVEAMAIYLGIEFVQKRTQVTGETYYEAKKKEASK